MIVVVFKIIYSVLTLKPIREWLEKKIGKKKQKR
jgi:hypothetical protein